MLGEPVFKFALSFQNGGVEPSIGRQTADADRDAFLQIAADRRCLRRCALLLYRPPRNLGRLLETAKADFLPVRLVERRPVVPICAPQNRALPPTFEVLRLSEPLS
jgi:hypothetical protein